MAVTGSFTPGTGVLALLGDSSPNAVTASRNAAGTILANGGAVAIQGGTSTVANTTLIQAFGLAGSDALALDRPTVPCRAPTCSAAPATTRSPAATATTRCSARAATTAWSGTPATTPT
jgi:hypothetical protein